MLACGAAVFAASAVQSATGFGFALLAGPVLFAVLDPGEALTALLTLGFVLNFLVLTDRAARDRVRWGELAPLLAAAVPGLAGGVLLLFVLPKAGLHGSSHYALPGPLRWFTANIGVHHIHHLCSRIPCYRLPLVLRDHPDLDGIGRLTLLQSLRCVRLVLWDEGQQRLVSFREVRRRCASS